MDIYSNTHMLPSKFLSKMCQVILTISLAGNLIKNLIVKDTDHYSSWSISDSINTGDLVFGDCEVTYTKLPDVISGAEGIITACDSKNSISDIAAFTVGADITVYIALGQ